MVVMVLYENRYVHAQFRNYAKQRYVLVQPANAIHLKWMGHAGAGKLTATKIVVTRSSVRLIDKITCMVDRLQPALRTMRDDREWKRW